MNFCVIACNANTARMQSALISDLALLGVLLGLIPGRFLLPGPNDPRTIGLH